MNLLSNLAVPCLSFDSSEIALLSKRESYELSDHLKILLAQPEKPAASACIWPADTAEAVLRPVLTALLPA